MEGPDKDMSGTAPAGDRARVSLVEPTVRCQRGCRLSANPIVRCESSQSLPELRGGGLAAPRYSPWRMADELVTREYRSGSDPRTLRDALGCFATGVTVVTCIDDQGVPVGFTANSFTSVSLDPPLLLVCIAKRARCAPALIGASHFAVNVLQAEQQPESIRFSTRNEDRFGSTQWSTGETGAPLLMDSLGVFECRNHAVHEGGDHHMLIGEVVRASFDPTMDPLLFFRGRYRRLHFD